MRLQLWSYNYDPEPTGIAPVSTVWARAMAERGHEVSVVAAHPHYPEPRWGVRVLPYREIRDGIPVLRLPLWIGRATTVARLRQEASYTAALTAALPALGNPDVIVAVSPCFPALLPTMACARLRRVPWVLWLQDILPDGAATTGILTEGALVSGARRLELAAYRSADRIVVISDSFAENLAAKGVPEKKLARIYNVASRPMPEAPRPEPRAAEPTVLTMGNIGHTQNLVAIVDAFQQSGALSRLGARLTITGRGVAEHDVRRAIRTDRITMPGLLESEELDVELRQTSLALVSQRFDGIDFNVPSKLMNFMAYGVPTVAAVHPDSEVARIVTASGGGWVASSPSDCAETVARVLELHDARRERGQAAWRFAQKHFSPRVSAAGFEAVLESAGDGECATAPPVCAVEPRYQPSADPPLGERLSKDSS